MQPMTQDGLDGHTIFRPANRKRRGWRRILHLMDVLYRWAESGWSGTAVAAWGVLQGAVVPGFADGLVVPLTVADPRRAYRLAAFAILGSVLGGMGAYLIGHHFFGEIGETILGWLGMNEARLATTRMLIERYGWLIIAFSAVAPISTKTVCITAGVLAMPFPAFAFGITTGRIIRFTFIATVLRFAGEKLRDAVVRKVARTGDAGTRGLGDEGR